MMKYASFLYYFLYFSAMAVCLPYIVLFYRSLHFSAGEIGILMGLAPLVSMLGAPLFTGLADSTGRHRLVMSIVIIAGIGFAILFPFARLFLPILCLVAMFSLVSAPASSFADSATMHMLGEEKALYGRIRLGGTIGYGIAAAIAGIIIQKYGIHWAFWGYACFMLLALIVCQQFTFSHRTRDASLGKMNWQAFASRRWITFFLLVFIGGVAFSAINYYFFPYMEDLGYSRTIMGISLTIATIGELPVLFFSNRMLRRIGAFGLLLVAIGALGLRLFLYAWLTSPFFMLFFQLLNGLTFPLLWVAGVSYADENAPEGLKATAQGMFGAIVLGLAASTGGVIGGLLFGSIGGQWMYVIFGSVVFISLGTLALLGRAERTRTARSTV